MIPQKLNHDEPGFGRTGFGRDEILPRSFIAKHRFGLHRESRDPRSFSHSHMVKKRFYRSDCHDMQRSMFSNHPVKLDHIFRHNMCIYIIIYILDV